MIPSLAIVFPVLTALLAGRAGAVTTWSVCPSPFAVSPYESHPPTVTRQPPVQLLLLVVVCQIAHFISSSLIPYTSGEYGFCGTDSVRLLSVPRS